MIPLSFSKLRNYKCPYRFKALYIDGYVEPSNEAMMVGSQVHMYAESRTQGRMPPLPEHPDAAKLAMAWDERGPCIPKGADAIGVEVPLAYSEGWKVADWEEADLFRGIVDLTYRVDDTLYVEDIKTGWGEPNPMQLRIYAALLGMDGMDYSLAGYGKPMEPPELVVGRFVVVHEQGVRVVESFANPWSKGWGSEVLDEIVRTHEEVNSRTDWPAVPCELCEHCSAPDCPERGGALALVAKDIQPYDLPSSLASVEDAEMAVKFLVLAKQFTSHAENLLKDWVKANGPVEAVGKVAEVRSSESWKPADMARLANALTASGIPSRDVWGAMSMSRTELERLLRKHGKTDIVNLFKSMGTAKQSERFGLFKAAPKY